MAMKINLNRIVLVLFYVNMACVVAAMYGIKTGPIYLVTLGLMMVCFAFSTIALAISLFK